MSRVQRITIVGQPFRRRNNRLPGDCYRNPGHVHFTLCTYERRSVFRDNQTTNRVSHILREAFALPLRLDAYCFMPDHLHLLVTSLANADPRSALARFKQGSAHAHRLSGGGRLWQRGFHDHVLRPDEELDPTIEYILGHPVRHGLCEDWLEWPYSWSRWPMDD